MIVSLRFATFSIAEFVSARQESGGLGPSARAGFSML